ncbi:hypothetical protein [Streptomyces lydicus]|uniref:hypothetical protein n=1 Tax=Streptomyces lydicus TaxID=47763 RepID=UPI001F5090DE|nr:hypothetical protein [Streptomyces lydicus]
MTRARVINACLTAAGAGVLAAVVRVLMQPSGALPRWDLLACLSLVVAGLAGALVCLRGGPAPEAGRVGTSTYWWPERNDGWIAAGLIVSFVPVGLFLYAALAFSPEAAQIIKAGGGIQAVSVQKVISSEYVRRKSSEPYEVVARVAVPFDAGARSEKAEFRSKQPVERGDLVWALYAPSSAELGVLVDSDRDALEEKAGGSAHWAMVGLVLFVMVVSLLWAVFVGGFRKASRGIRTPLKKGYCRSLPVMVKSVGVVMDGAADVEDVTATRPKPRVKFEGYEWELLLDPVIDPPHLSREIKGSDAKLYWVQFAANRTGVREVRAMLVLDGQRCVQGLLRVSGETESPEGVPVPAAESLPEGDGLRAIRTYPVWDPKLHSEGLGWLVAAVVGLGAVVFGVGRWGAGILCLGAYGCLLIARFAVNENRRQYLKSFLPSSEPETGQ